MNAPVLEPDAEAQRLRVLRSYQVLDTPPELQFDQLTALGAEFLDTRWACVTLVDEERIWFKSAHGVARGEMARIPGFCSSALASASSSSPAIQAESSSPVDSSRIFRTRPPC